MPSFIIKLEGRGYYAKYNTPRKLKKGCFTTDLNWAQPFATQEIAQTAANLIPGCEIIEAFGIEKYIG